MTSEENDDNTWLETDASASKATGPAAAAVLASVAQTLEKAPDAKRFDISLEVDEHE